MELFKYVKNILLEPTKFFTNLKKDNNLGKAFLFLAILSLFSVVLGFFMSELMQPYGIALAEKVLGFEIPIVEQSLGWRIGSMALGYLMGLGISFVIVAILHVWLMLFSVPTRFVKTYQLYAYAKAPSYLFGWIPFIGGLAWIYEFILLIIGTQKVYDTSKKKAVWIYAIPVIFFMVMIILGFIALMTAINTLGPAIMQNLTLQ